MSQTVQEDMRDSLLFRAGEAAELSAATVLISTEVAMCAEQRKEVLHC